MAISSGLEIDHQQEDLFQCPNSGSELTFELIESYHIKEEKLVEAEIDSNSIQLCIEACRQNSKCHSLSFQQDAGCVLFKTNALSLNISPDAGI